MIIFATGFDAVTGAISRISVTGRDDRDLNDHWEGYESLFRFDWVQVSPICFFLMDLVQNGALVSPMFLLNIRLSGSIVVLHIPVWRKAQALNLDLNLRRNGWST